MALLFSRSASNVSLRRFRSAVEVRERFIRGDFHLSVTDDKRSFKRSLKIPVPAKNRFVNHKKKKRRGAPQGRNGPLPTAQCGLMTPLRSPEGHGHPTGALRPRLGEWRFRVFFALPGMCTKTKKTHSSFESSRMKKLSLSNLISVKRR